MQKNAITPFALWKVLSAKKRYPQKADTHYLNWIPENYIHINELHNLTGYNNLDAMSFKTAISKLGLKVDNKSSQRKRTLDGLIDNNCKFCPLCLQEKLIYKLIWQVKENKICSDHGIYLLDRCPHCSSKIPCLSGDSLVGLCPYCQEELFNSAVTHASKTDLKVHKRIWEDWEYLLNPVRFSFVNHNNFSIESELALKLIYLHDKFAKKNSEFPQRQILMQVARKSRATKAMLHMQTILKVLRNINVSLEYFAKTVMPEEFIQKTLYPQLLRNKYSCIAPWCPSYNKPGSLVRTSTSKKELKSGLQLKYYLYCKDCFTEYAVEKESEQLIERKYFISLGWEVVRDKALSGKSIKKISKELGISNYKVTCCMAFLLANNLLPQWIYEKYNFNKREAEGPKLMAMAISNGENIKTLCKKQKWSRLQSLYYWYTPEVRKEWLKTEPTLP